ncbi:hypothetical protein [Maribacter halichondriae]|uniref:hypothetical protein n=1 Tax=Maribacter halichondriae TaxID=2980554 RepID=UPI002359C661|nr:hypothetical protein [Maribacter sp. Hal144]
MKIQYPLALLIFIALAKYYDRNPNVSKVDVNEKNYKSYKLLVERGAFHDDSFQLTFDSIVFVPSANSFHDVEKYILYNTVSLDSSLTINFFKELEYEGFWKLKDTYKTESSCTSQLRVTLMKGQKSKTVLCDDFERDCPELMKYIDKKVVELEGNDLKRFYLPG